jgi:cyclic pyranopterin phosphate synthase
MVLLHDTFGRAHEYLRISITDVCNFRCIYCLPEGYKSPATPRTQLGSKEINRAVSALAKIGVKKVRITGGEPGIRADLQDIIHRVASVSGIQKVAITTNGTAICDASPPLATSKILQLRLAGCSQINLSLDSLNALTFEQITGRTNHSQILSAIDAILTEGGMDLKINSVLLNSLNSNELPQWLDFVKERNITVRFIELMPTEGAKKFHSNRFLSTNQWQQKVEDLGFNEMPSSSIAGPAREYSHPNYAGRIGFISPISRKFCGTCNRLRLTSVGEIHTCALEGQGDSIRHLLQSPLQEIELIKVLSDIVSRKGQEHLLHSGSSDFQRSFSKLGG